MKFVRHAGTDLEKRQNRALFKLITLLASLKVFEGRNLQARITAYNSQFELWLDEDDEI